MARKISNGSRGLMEQAMKTGPDLGLSSLERVTGIEPALSAWESVPSGPVTGPDLQGGVSKSDRERPLFTGVNGPASQGTAWTDGHAPVLPVLLDGRYPSGRGRLLSRPAK
jgi:hypothetical protein